MSDVTLDSYARGIYAIDTDYVRPRLDASHLVVRNGHAAFVDCGTNHSVPYLLAALKALEVAPEAVDYLFLTHIHLDHAGGAGRLMEALPHATCVVHPKGAPHLSDTGQLEAGTRATYGNQVYDTLYGELVPIPAERIRSVEDGETIRLDDSPFRFLHTPGHALHHVAIHDETAKSVFAGDIFGIAYRVFDNPAGEPFIFPATTPTQFDPDQMHASIDRITALSPRAVFLTHYSRVTDIERLAADLHACVDRYVEIAREHENDEDARNRIRHALHDYLAGRLEEHGTQIEAETRETWLEMDMNLNAAGLLAWRERLARQRERAQ
ncbi:MAG: MBL fold metallo-hydrolase [Gammaproteobacteria bacterium]|nr:MBL fold metallo-hydrolase [Gammaproteobacteria bacterium]